MARDPASPWQGLPPRQLAGHPDAPPQVLLGLCRRYPREVLGNASLPVLSLVDPAAWTSIVFRSRAVIAKGLIDGHAARCDQAAAIWFLVGCAEQVLPLLEKHDPADTLPRRLLEAATSVACGKLDPSTLSALWTDSPPGHWSQPPIRQARWLFDILARVPSCPIRGAAELTAEALAFAAGPRDSAPFDRAHGEELERQVCELERLSPLLRQGSGGG